MLARIIALFSPKSRTNRAAAKAPRALCLEPLEERLAPATFYVSNSLDSGPGSLRQAILNANATAVADVIRFRATVTSPITLDSGTLQITRPVNIIGPGATNLTVTRDPGADTEFRIFTVDNAATSAIAVTISGLTISGGVDINGGGVYNENETLTIKNCVISNNTSNNFSCGGGVFSAGGSLTITGSTISQNIAECDGGGIAVLGGTAFIQNSIIDSNEAAAGGGGVLSEDATLTIITSIIRLNIGGDGDGGGIAIIGGTASLQSVSVLENNTNGYGGGIFVTGAILSITGGAINGNEMMGFGEGGGITVSDGSTVTIDRVTIDRNHSFGNGGGVDVTDFDTGSVVLILNSTISNNIADGEGGGVHACGFNGSTITMQNVTIADNEAGFDGGGVLVSIGSVTLLNATVAGNDTLGQEGAGGITNFDGTVTMRNTIVAANGLSSFFPVDLFGDFTANYCLLGEFFEGTNINGSNNIIGVDPMLGPLQSNGGPTLTRALLAGSQAINAGDPAYAPPPSTDQRGAGYNRVIGGRLDIGAYEFQPAATTTTLTSSRNPSRVGQLVTFTATVQATAPGSNTPQGTVTFFVDGVALATANVISGVAKFSTAALKRGTHTVIAFYNGFDLGNYHFDPSSSSPLTQRVIAITAVRRWDR